MDLRQLRYFVAVAERGGFAAAASALNVAQSALSRHVKELERELGGALLERGARGVSATESGKVLMTRGRWLLGLIDDVKAEVRTENREPSGTVRLGAPSSLGDIFYAPLARLIAKRFPRVRLELSEGLTEAMCDRLLAKLLGCALLAALVIGSGIAAQQLSPSDVGLQLLENAAATAAGLFAISLMFGPVSGGHFNPVVSLADASFGGLSRRDAHLALAAHHFQALADRFLLFFFERAEVFDIAGEIVYFRRHMGRQKTRRNCRQLPDAAFAAGERIPQRRLGAAQGAD